MMKLRELSALSSDASCQLDVFRHDGDSLGVDSAQVGVFEEADQICFAGFLERHYCRTLEAQIGLEVLGDLPYQTLERQLANQQFGTLLITTNFTKSDGSGPVAMGFFHSAGGRCALPRSLGGQLLSGSLSSCRFTSGLLGTGHFER